MKDAPNHYWRTPESKDRKRIETVNDRLIKWIGKTFEIQFPGGYKLYRLNKAAGTGVNEFTFNIDYGEIDPVNKTSLKDKFFRRVEQFQNEDDPAEKEKLEEQIMEIVAQGLSSKVLSKIDVQKALSPGRQNSIKMSLRAGRRSDHLYWQCFGR